MSTFAKAWLLVLAAALVAGVAGIVENGWRHPGDTIGAAVWFALAVAVVVVIRRSHEPRSPK